MLIADLYLAWEFQNPKRLVASGYRFASPITRENPQVVSSATIKREELRALKVFLA